MPNIGPTPARSRISTIASPPVRVTDPAAVSLREAAADVISLCLPEFQVDPPLPSAPQGAVQSAGDESDEVANRHAEFCAQSDGSRICVGNDAGGVARSPVAD